MVVVETKDNHSVVASNPKAWTMTGFEPDNSPIEPLTPKTFVQRLVSMTSALEDIEKMRRAMPGTKGSGKNRDAK